MKKFVLSFAVVAATFTIATGAFAQAAGPKGGVPQGGAPGRPQGGRMMGGMGMNRARLTQMQQELMAKLNLTPDQKKKIEALDKKRADKMKPLIESMRKPGADRQKLSDSFRGIMMDYNKDLNKILTKDQQRKLVSARKEMMEKFRSQSGSGRGAAPKAP